MIKIPDEIFVVSENRPEHEYAKDPVTGVWSIANKTDHNFGFLHPHEPTKAADSKRKYTQMNWAYHGQAYEKEPGIWWRKGVEYTWDPVIKKSNPVPFDYVIEPQYAPRVWENVPMRGFKLIDTVNRYRGNKLFKVMDPRGVEFEITVASLFQILCDGTVQEGEIMNTCVWKAGKNLMVVKDQ